MILRRPHADTIRRQLDLFEGEHTALLADIDAAMRRYDAAPRDEAEERYGDYLDLVETGAEILARLRDTFASTMAEDAAERYVDAFNRATAKRFPRFAVVIEDA